MRVLVLSSGGKDSTMASWWAKCKGWEISALVTVRVKGDDSWMFQIPGTSITKLHAEAQGIEWIEAEVSGENDVEVDELEHILEPIVSDTDCPIDAIVCGALASEYQRRRIERMSHRLGVISFTPIWHNKPREHMGDLIDCGFEIMIVSVSSDGLNEEWLGRIIDAHLFARLESIASEYRFSIDGEGGEYETVVIAGPHMSKRIEISGKTHWEGSRGEFLIDSAILV